MQIRIIGMKKNNMKKRLLLFCYGIFFVAPFLFSNELNYTREKTASLDIELSEVNLIIAPGKENRIGYRFELSEGKRLSCIETNRTLRIREILPAKGNLYVFIPEDLLLESCMLRSSRAAITMKDIRAVHSLIIMNDGAVTISKSTLKNAVINVARGKLIFNSDILRSCAFSVSGSIADVTLPHSSDQYNLDYVHTGGSFTIDAKDMRKTKSPGVYGNPKAKRRLIFSAGSSQAAIRFSHKETTK